ncbi:MAG: SGNH/GDSL hydrolase family protein [Lachnospiraceae bacterium]
MKELSKISFFGDSILKGIQINPSNNKYYTKNDMDMDAISTSFRANIQNFSRFGCTVTKGAALLEARLEKGMDCDAVIMDFGGNDCDFTWADIAQNPEGNFLPHTPIEEFSRVYRDLIVKLKEHAITPILTTLPPLEPQRFFDWFCKDLDKENILKWLGSIKKIYTHQEAYSREVEKIAALEKVPLVDIRKVFLQKGPAKELLCEDGTHPNSRGQKAITEAFLEFSHTWAMV